VHVIEQLMGTGQVKDEAAELGDGVCVQRRERVLRQTAKFEGCVGTSRPVRGKDLIADD
jgi:hypothetical protein